MAKKGITQKIDNVIKEIKTLKINSASDFQNIAKINSILNKTRKSIFRLEISYLVMLETIIKKKLLTQEEFDKRVNEEVEKIVEREKKDLAEKEVSKKEEEIKKKDELPK